MRKLLVFKFLVLFIFCSAGALMAQGHEGHDHGSHDGHNHGTENHDSHAGHNHDSHAGHNHGADAHEADSHGDDHGGHHSEVICGETVDHEFNVGEVALHHIADANVYSIGPWHIPLPVMLYSLKDGNFDVFTTKAFKNDFAAHHADGHVAHKGYVLHGGTIKRVDVSQTFDRVNDVPVHGFITREEMVDGKEKEVTYVCAGAGASSKDLYRLENSSTADFGLFGGGITSFIDFSMTKNVVSMLFVCLILFFLFRSVAKAYKKREGKEPKGLQSFMETFVVFIRDEVAIPFLGHKWEKYFNLLASIFFFILGLNLFGQIPFLGGSNVTGNLAVTAVLAIIAFLVTNIKGNAHYWGHLFNPPGVPLFVKLILVPVELMGIFIKPITLMLRLFANIAAGHIVLIVFVGLIFIFGQLGEVPAAGWATGVGSVLLSLFMMAIELIVALVQAFVFTLLTASYIGASTEEAHH